MRAYVQLAKLRLLTALTYRFDVYASIAANLVLMLATVFLWQTAYRGIGTTRGVDEQQMVTYAIMSALLGSVFAIQIDGLISEKIREGSIAMDFIRPIRPVFAWLAEDVGRAVGALVMQLIPLLIFSMIFIRIPLPRSVAAALLFLPSCILSFGILWLLSLISGLVAFWTLELGHLGIVRAAVERILSGSLVPLWFFPLWAQSISRFLPFQYTYQLPLSIYVGRAGAGEALRGMVIQCAWIVLLGALLAWVWSRGSRRVLVQGG